MLAALALIFALAHLPFLATSLEDIDSVNFALGVRDFDVATHRPHPPGYPVYIFLGKIATAIAGLVMDAPPSTIEAKALSVLSLLGGLLRSSACMSSSARCAVEPPQLPSGGASVDLRRLRRDGDHRVLSVVLVSGGAADERSAGPCLRAGVASVPDAGMEAADAGRRRRSTPAGGAHGSSGRMIVIGAFLAAVSIGLRSQTVWFTVPLLVLVLFDRIGRGVAGAMLGGGVMFVVGGLFVGHPAVDRQWRLERLSRRARHPGRRGFCRRRNALYESESALRSVRAVTDVCRTHGIQRRWPQWSSSWRRRG